MITERTAHTSFMAIAQIIDMGSTMTKFQITERLSFTKKYREKLLHYVKTIIYYNSTYVVNSNIADQRLGAYSDYFTDYKTTLFYKDI